MSVSPLIVPELSNCRPKKICAARFLHNNSTLPESSASVKTVGSGVLGRRMSPEGVKGIKPGALAPGKPFPYSKSPEGAQAVHRSRCLRPFGAWNHQGDPTWR